MGWYIYTALDDPETKVAVVRDDAAVIHQQPPMWREYVIDGKQVRKCVSVAGIEVARTDRMVLCAINQVRHLDEWQAVSEYLDGARQLPRIQAYRAGDKPPVPRDLADLPEHRPPLPPERP